MPSPSGAPNPEQLRKQAKDLLRACRASDSRAVARLTTPPATPRRVHCQARRRFARATADPSVNMRRHAALALGACGGDARAAATLESLIARESDPALPRNARWALRRREGRLLGK
ncbi:MAG: hypothetical protein ACRDHE_02020 [Ktedonobacterales bacterium]